MRRLKNSLVSVSGGLCGTYGKRYVALFSTGHADQASPEEASVNRACPRAKHPHDCAVEDKNAEVEAALAASDEGHDELDKTAKYREVRRQEAKTKKCSRQRKDQEHPG